MTINKRRKFNEIFTKFGLGIFSTMVMGLPLQFKTGKRLLT
jgi:hypothetical protein